MKLAPYSSMTSGFPSYLSSNHRYPSSLNLARETLKSLNIEDKKLREARQRIEMLMEEKALEKEFEL